MTTLSQAEQFLLMLPAQTGDFNGTRLFSQYRRAKCDAKRLLAKYGARLRLTCTKLSRNNYLYDVIEAE